jgi:hypothetical protein
VQVPPGSLPFFLAIPDGPDQGQTVADAPVRNTLTGSQTGSFGPQLHQRFFRAHLRARLRYQLCNCQPEKYSVVQSCTGHSWIIEYHVASKSPTLMYTLVRFKQFCLDSLVDPHIELLI